MRTRPLPRNFASGELAPWYDGLATEITQKGCRTLENFIVKKQGQAQRRPGTFFVAEAKDSSTASVLLPVTIDDDNTYVLEIGDAYIRFYKNHAQVTSSGTAYEVTSPWSSGDVAKLWTEYIPDEKALYFWHGSYNTRRLVWTSDASWTLEQVPYFQSLPAVVVDSAGRLAISEDGKAWIEKRATIDSQGRIDYTIARGRRNLVISVPLDNSLLGDEDAENWISLGTTALPYVQTLRGNQQGEIVAGGGAGYGSGTIYVSLDDGETWVQKVSTAYHTPKAVSFDKANRHWMAVGYNTRQYNYAIEDASWVSLTETASLLDVAHGSDLWVAVGLGTIRYAGSVAAAWGSVTMTGTLQGVDMGTPGGSNLWIAVGKTSGNNAVIYSSPTGTVWTQRYNSSSVASEFSDVRWIGHMYIAVGGYKWNGTPTNTIFAYSYDGITWYINTELSRAKAHAWQEVSYRQEEGITDLNLSPNFPALGVYHEGRLTLVPDSKPATIMGSKTGVLNNFYLGDFSDQAYEYKLGGGRNVDIQWLMGGMGGIVVGTRTAEGILIGSPDEGITPQTAQMKWLSTFGSANIQPVRVHDMIVFVQRGGEIVRGYVPQQGAYQSPELTAYSDHIAAGGILSLDYQDDPQTMVHAVRADGQGLALTMDNGMRAWARIKPASTSLSVGMIESMAIIPTTGAEDEIWLLVNRKVAAGTKRYIEYMDTLAVASFAAAHYVDSGVYKTSGTTFQVVGALTHLAGENVDAFISAPASNIRWIAGLTVAASGTITTAPYSGTDIHVGLPYTSYLQTMRGDYGSAWGDGAGLEKRTTNVLAWVHDSSALAKFGPTQALATETIPYSSSVALNTEICVVNFPGQFDRDNYLWCIVTDPRPFTLVAILPDSETGDH